MAKKIISNEQLLAPNGKPSNLNATQYALVRSKPFKDWFGDWENDPENSSQVVDENGEPLVVYRGYPKKRKFPNVFEYKYRMFSKSGVSGREKNEFAFYFTDLKEVAEEYGKNLADDEEYVVKQYFLNIRNLFEAFSYKNQYQITFKELYDLANKSGEPIYELNYDDEIKLFYQKNENGEYEMLPREWWEYDSFRSKYLFENTPHEVYAYFVDWDKKSSNQFFWRAYLQRYLKYDGLVFYERTHNDELNPNRDEDDYYSVEKPWVLPSFGDEFSKTYGVFESNQIKLADGTNTTFDKKNPDIRFEQGGEIKIDKILSSSSRFKPSEVIVFDPPLIGTNGNKLISYEWKYDWESRTSREGDEYGKRISDWTQAEESAETGRDLVHIYTIELKDKSIKNVSSESVLILLGLVEKEQKKIFGNIATASKTLAKQQMKLAILEAQKKQYDEAKETLEKAEKPPIKIAKFDELPIVTKSVIERKGSTNEIYFVMGDVNAPQDLPYSKLINFRDYDNISISQYPPTKNTIENLENRWLFKRLNELNLKYPSDLYNLKNRVERQTKKVENMIKVDSFKKGGVIPTNKKVGWGIFGFVVGIITLGTINSK